MAFSSILRGLARLSPGIYSKNFNTVNYALRRNLTKDVKLNWVRPPDLPSYHPSQTGDLQSLKLPDNNERREYFDSSELLDKTANDNVKKIFSMGNQTLRHQYYWYKMSLINKVKDHKEDHSSLHVRIAGLTARIRIVHHKMAITKKSTRKYRAPLNELIHKRRKFLKLLRAKDYKRFEWLLEQLDLKYYPVPITKEIVTRKRSTKLLAEYRMEKLKQLKHAEYRKKLDQEKVPFLERKLKALYHIKEQEMKLKLVPTVNDSDIENCIKQIEDVKLQVEENQKKDYVKKVHPYTLEVYSPRAFEKPEAS